MYKIALGLFFVALIGFASIFAGICDIYNTHVLKRRGISIEAKVQKYSTKERGYFRPATGGRIVTRTRHVLLLYNFGGREYTKKAAVPNNYFVIREDKPAMLTVDPEKPDRMLPGNARDYPSWHVWHPVGFVIGIIIILPFFGYVIGIIKERRKGTT